MPNDFRVGHLRDVFTGVLAVTSDTTGARFVGGLLRAPSGALVVVFQ